MCLYYNMTNSNARKLDSFDQVMIIRIVTKINTYIYIYIYENGNL